MPPVSALSSAVVDSAKTFLGQLLSPGDAGYDDARRVHNGLIDKRPALIARCRGVGDIVDAVHLARTLKLEVAVRGGGHNVAGRATVDGGLMIDLSQMRGILVDAKGRVARAQGGATWGEFNRETQVHGLATTGGVISTTGIGGLTLGGGIGWLMAKHGLALDNLLAADLVLADGRAVRASRDENADLFWAIRGGGGNFGIASSLEYRLHPVGPGVVGGLIAFPFTAARDVLRFFRDFATSISDDVFVVAALLTAPGADFKLAAIGAAYLGEQNAGEAALRPIKGLGTPVMDTIGPITYSQLNSMLDGAFPRGASNYWKSHLLADLSDEAIDTMIDRFSRVGSPLSQMLLEHFHGAAMRVPVGDTACALRRDGFNLLVVSQWMDPAQSDAQVAWARDAYSAMQPFVSPLRYLNYLGDDEPGDPLAAAYGANYQRLRELKTKYDPENFFHLNQNIRPL